MSDSPEARAHSDNDNVDEIADNSGEPESAPQADPSPPKRKRGRPPGSKNKKTLAAEAALAATGSSTESPRRPRGRPPKVKKPEEEKKTHDEGESSEPPPKRKRGRPRKNPLPEQSAGEEPETSAAAETPAKKKRGRPPKIAS